MDWLRVLAEVERPLDPTARNHGTKEVGAGPADADATAACDCHCHCDCDCDCYHSSVCVCVGHGDWDRQNGEGDGNGWAGQLEQRAWGFRSRLRPQCEGLPHT